MINYVFLSFDFVCLLFNYVFLSRIKGRETEHVTVNSIFDMKTASYFKPSAFFVAAHNLSFFGFLLNSYKCVVFSFGREYHDFLIR